jgi:hypothetical protein
MDLIGHPGEIIGYPCAERPMAAQDRGRSVRRFAGMAA